MATIYGKVKTRRVAPEARYALLAGASVAQPDAIGIDVFVTQARCLSAPFLD